MKKEGFDCSEIITNTLFLGSAKASKDFDSLKEKKITHIVNISGKQFFPNDFIYFRSHFEDSNDSNLLENFDEIFSFLDDSIKSGGKILIHCQGGVSRSPSVVIGFLIHKYSMNYQEAFDLVKIKRKGIKIKVEFMKQLQEYEKKKLKI
jgi:protein-tyrosine phosphatase